MLALVFACALTTTAHLPVPVELTGNEVLATEVYLAVLDLPDDAEADAITAATVQLQLTAFLHRSGYELAHVVAAPVDGRILVQMDEGRLERLVFRGRFTFQMLRFKLGLDLPRDVYNRPQLERVVALLSKQLAIETPTWELRRTRSVEHQGPQVENLGPLGTIKGLPLVHAQEAHELYFHFSEREWSTGLGLDIRTGYFDGFELGLSYQGSSLVARDDRWRLGLMAGAGLREDIPSKSLYVFPSRLFAEAQWHTPALDQGNKVRPFFWLRGEGLARQRKDLRLENYYSTDSAFSLNLGYQPVESLRLFAGYGLQHYFVFGPTGVVGDPPLEPLSEPQRLRHFFQLNAELTFSTPDARWDRRHALWAGGRLFSNFNRVQQPIFAELNAGYQKVFALGWHDLWFKLRARWVSGDVFFTFEEPLGDHLRATFGDIWVRAAASGHSEFHFSLTRDLYKLGVFVDAAAFGELDRVTLEQRPRFGIAFGPTFHALIEGMFQLDMALSFGFVSSAHAPNVGVNVVLLKVF